MAADCVASHDPEHHDVTLRYLDGKIGRVLATAEILSLVRALPKPSLRQM